MTQFLSKRVEKKKENAIPFVYYISKDYVNNFLFSQEIESNKCLIFMPEYFEKTDGTKLALIWNIIDGIDSTRIHEIKFMEILGRYPKFRDGVNDFHVGLLDTSNSPAHFYRVIDTLSQFVIGKDGKLENAEWSEFKKLIKLDDEEIEELDALTEVGAQYRHGNRTTPINDYVRLLKVSKIIIIKTYEYVLQKSEQK